ncbi:MAG: hypothetical protein IJ193_05820 [Bacilli bacterium]|nr:hypothetical protein [Bacilli bacterium]
MEEEKEVVEKKKKGHGVVYFILILILIIAGLVCYILIDKGVVEVPYISNTTEVKEKNTKNTKDTSKEKYTELSIENASVIDLYENVHYRFNITGGDPLVFNNKKLSFDDMDEHYKIGLAGNLFKDKGYNTNGEQYYYYKDVKNAYEKIFGPGTFKGTEKFDLNCGDYVLDNAKKLYVNTSNGCGGTSPFSIIEKMISAKKYSDRIEITSAALFYDAADNQAYKDYSTKEKLADVIVGQSADVSDLEKYVQNNSSKLQQYTYTFELNDDGFYYYTGVERTQE